MGTTQIACQLIFINNLSLGYHLKNGSLIAEHNLFINLCFVLGNMASIMMIIIMSIWGVIV